MCAVVVVGAPAVDTVAGRFGVALAERNLGGRVVGASHWLRYPDGSAIRWFDSEREAVLAVVGAGFDLSRWAVWCFPAGRLFPECRGVVSDLLEFDGQAVRS